MGQSVFELSNRLFLWDTPKTIDAALDVGAGSGFFDEAERWKHGYSRHDYQRDAQNARKMIAETFAGDAVEWRAFIRRLRDTEAFSVSAKDMKFSTLAEHGSLDRLARLEKTDRGAFAALVSGRYSDVASFDRALEKVSDISQMVTDRNRRATRFDGPQTAVTIPAVDALTPNDLTCAGRKRGSVSCDWDKAAATPTVGAVEKEAANLLKAGAELLESLGKALSPQGPRPK